jgi:colanic acid biosynthesis protein WcaH
MFLDENTFKTVIASTPLVSIDLLVKNTQGQYLLGYRTNRPAQGFWFVPGGRIHKNESMDAAFVRLTKAELGVQIERQSARFIGPFEHFYDDFVFGHGVSTHYVVLGYEIILNINIDELPAEQHSQYKWFEQSELIKSANVHQHSKWYVKPQTNGSIK